MSQTCTLALRIVFVTKALGSCLAGVVVIASGFSAIEVVLTSLSVIKLTSS